MERESAFFNFIRQQHYAPIFLGQAAFCTGIAPQFLHYQ
jgi:hypothetical protein